LATGLFLPKLCLQFQDILLEGNPASRCSIASKNFFYKSPLGGSCKHFSGGCRFALLRYWSSLHVDMLVSPNATTNVAASSL